MPLVKVRKRRAGSDSAGHVWAHDGDIVEMPFLDAVPLLAIRDAGFEIVEDPVGPEPDDTEPDPSATADTGAGGLARGTRRGRKATEIAETDTP